MIEATKKNRIVDGSDNFVGRWNKLVSTTNWEKGKIIQLWRADLAERGLPPSAYSDEAWAHKVGNISSQHVGRLRRVFERFDATRDQFTNLHWSHFSQAIDWDEAEMWLEGAMRNGWSVAETRLQRARAMGAVEDVLVDDNPDPFDEDSDPLDRQSPLTPSVGVVHDFQKHGDDDEEDGDLDDDEEDASRERSSDGDSDLDDGDGFGEVQSSFSRYSEPDEMRSRLFESLPPLPADLADAVEVLKLNIVRHRLSNWNEVPCDHLVAHLDALQALVMAPASDD